jgi:hypothetical protein
MRAYVAQASGGRDTLELHQEKPLNIEAQQALALASQMVSEDSQATMTPFVQQIQGLAQKVQQAQQAQMQQAAAADPTAQVILKTQMAETERKAAESQARMQLEQQKDAQEYQIKIAELQQKVQDLQAKYQVQTALDANKNATQIAMADINNASRERVAAIQAQVGLTSDQMAMAHEQNLTALEASHQAQSDIRKHGIDVEQAAFQQQAAMVNAQIQAQQQAALAEQQHNQALQQQAIAPQPPTQGQ